MTEQISLGVELHDEEEIEITFDIIRVVCKYFVKNLPILKEYSFVKGIVFNK